MTITGRLTAGAVVATLPDERKVVNFSVAINERCKSKGGERVQVTTYCNCSYWISEKIAPHLKKGTLVELAGRIYVTPYVSRNGEPRASLNCHVSSVKFLAKGSDVEVIGRPAAVTGSEPATGNPAAEKDPPF